MDKIGKVRIGKGNSHIYSGTIKKIFSRKPEYRSDVYRKYIVQIEKENQDYFFYTNFRAYTWTSMKGGRRKHSLEAYLEIEPTFLKSLIHEYDELPSVPKENKVYLERFGLVIDLPEDLQYLNCPCASYSDEETLDTLSKPFFNKPIPSDRLQLTDPKLIEVYYNLPNQVYLLVYIQDRIYFFSNIESSKKEKSNKDSITTNLFYLIKIVSEKKLIQELKSRTLRKVSPNFQIAEPFLFLTTESKDSTESHYISPVKIADFQRTNSRSQYPTVVHVLRSDFSIERHRSYLTPFLQILAYSLFLPPAIFIDIFIITPSVMIYTLAGGEVFKYRP